MESAATPSNQAAESLAAKVRSAVIWRSGSQILAQMVQWAATFLVIRILSPADYGLFAMTGVVLVFLNMLNGYGLASGLIQQPDITRRQIRQLFGMLIVLNVALGGAQLLLAPRRRGLLPPAGGRGPAARPGGAVPHHPVHRAPLRAAQPRDGFLQAGAGQHPRARRQRRRGAGRRARRAGACGRWCSRRSCCSPSARSA